MKEIYTPNQQELRHHFEPGQIDDIARDELREAGLFPKECEPVDVEAYLLRRHGMEPQWENLPETILGGVIFGPKKAEHVVLNVRLAEWEDARVSWQRRSTLAHECGHIALHSSLYCAPDARGHRAQSSGLVLCGNGDIEGESSRLTLANRQRKDWRLEWQANQFMAAFLLPSGPTRRAVARELKLPGAAPRDLRLSALQLNSLARLLSRLGDVSPRLAGIRLQELFPESTERHPSPPAPAPRLSSAKPFPGRFHTRQASGGGRGETKENLWS